MIQSFRRLLIAALAGAGLVPIAIVILCRWITGQPFSFGIGARLGLALAAIALVAWAAAWLWRRKERSIDALGLAQSEFLASIPSRHLSLAVIGSAAIGLALELAVIRWQGSVFVFFSFYKNFSLLAGFAGLALGYALARRAHIFLCWTIPLLAFQFVFLIALRHGLSPVQFDILMAAPFREQLHMGLNIAGTLPHKLVIGLFLAVVFLLTALAFIPVGQLCGRLLTRKETLPAYGLNLLGSLGGVLVMHLASLVWSPPLIWFAPIFGGLLLFYPRRRPLISAGALSIGVALAVLAWPAGHALKTIYSPYQTLELQRGSNGLISMLAGGHYHQRIHDLSDARMQSADDGLRRIRDYYELPYRTFGRPRTVAVVGAGTGNDVAAALRRGAASVDAIEIDPAILRVGRQHHPEHPYDDPRVHAVVDDARSFLRTTDRTYDMVVYGLLDSHTLLSHVSSVRIDSYVYTVEGLREARSRLNDGGILSLSFCVLSDQLGRKVYRMLQEAFDGTPPLCIRTDYDGSVVFLEGRNRQPVVPPELLQSAGFRNVSHFFANPAIPADVSTDDWPFFYIPKRVFPFSYLFLIAVVVGMTLVLNGVFIRERPTASQLPFFLLGVGFMLIETKGVTELGLTFGNTWQVIGIVISGILAMSFLANWTVQRIRPGKLVLPFALLGASLLAGWWVARGGGLPFGGWSRLGSAALLTCPLYFSGIVFSSLLARRGDISAAMAANLLGAMCGGLLEYSSMYFGFRFLYLLALVLYGLAFLSTRLERPSIRAS
jgi:hypothetical protein